MRETVNLKIAILVIENLRFLLSKTCDSCYRRLAILVIQKLRLFLKISKIRGLQKLRLRLIFDDLWKYMEEKNIPETRLLEYGITERQFRALKRNNSRQVSTRVIELLCISLNCRPDDIMENRP